MPNKPERTRTERSFTHLDKEAWRISWDMAETARRVLRELREATTSGGNTRYGPGTRDTAETLLVALDAVREGRPPAQVLLNSYEGQLMRRLMSAPADAPLQFVPTGSGREETEGKIIADIRKRATGAKARVGATRATAEWYKKAQERSYRSDKPDIHISRQHGGHKLLSVLVPAGLVMLVAHYLMKE